MRWNTYSSRASLARYGTHWTAVGPGADQAHPLVRELVHRSALRSHRRCSRSPTGWCGTSGRGTSRSPGSRAASARSAGRCRAPRTGRSAGHPAGLDDPERRGPRPSSARSPRYGTARRSTGRTACRCAGSGPGSPGRARTSPSALPGLFQQRHVHHRRRVALRAGIPVPVPGAAEAAALLDDPDVDAASRSRAPTTRRRTPRRRTRPSGGRSWAPVRSTVCADRPGSARARR